MCWRPSAWFLHGHRSARWDQLRERARRWHDARDSHSSISIAIARRRSIGPCSNGLTAGFTRVRAAGIKVILRFNYNDGPNGSPGRGARTDRRHITQLAPILRDERRRDRVLQAGFIGAWGEWHDSTNGLDTHQPARRSSTALCDALPADRMVQVRTPCFVDAMSPGGPLGPEQGFYGTPAPASATTTTASSPAYGRLRHVRRPVETWKDYVAADSRFTPMGGETCKVDSPRSDCESATAEMARLHMTYVNSQYHQDGARGLGTQGCMPAIQRRLGYRLVLVAAILRAVRPGGPVCRLEIALRNDGFASPLNIRPLRIVLDSGSRALRRRDELRSVVTDSRLQPGEHEVATTLCVPSDLAAGHIGSRCGLRGSRSRRRLPSTRSRSPTPTCSMRRAGWMCSSPALAVDPNAPGEAISDAHKDPSSFPAVTTARANV